MQTVDIPATILDFFGIPITNNMSGRPIHGDKRVERRKLALFGLFGGQLNATDGRYVYMKTPTQKEFPYAYTLAGTHFMRQRIQEGTVPYTVELGRCFSFSKGYRLLKIGNMGNDFQTIQKECETQLFDIQNDQEQKNH